MNEDREPYEKFMASMNEKFQEDEHPKSQEEIKTAERFSIPYAMTWTDTGDTIEIHLYLEASAKGAQININPYDLTVKVADINSQELFTIFERLRFYSRIISEDSFWSISNAGSKPEPELSKFSLILGITLAKPNIDQHIPWPHPFEHDLNELGLKSLGT